MGAGNLLSLLFEINADPSQAEAALKRFEATTGSSIAKVTDAAAVAGKTFDTQMTPALQRTTAGTQQAQAAALVLEQQMGVHLPRSITGMLAHSSLIGPALTAAFAPAAIILFAENFPKLIHGIQDAADTIGGFGKDAKKAFEEIIKANQEALIKFQGLTTQAKIATGQFLIMQTNQRLAALEQEKNAAVFSSNFTRYLAMAGAMGLVGLMQAKQGRTSKEINDEIAKQQSLLIKQIQEMGLLETDLGKKRKKAKEDDLWQTERLISAVKEYTGISRTLQGQLDSGTSPALRRYLQVEEKLAALALKLDVSMLRRQNLALYQKQVTEELANAHIKLTDRLQAETKFNDVLAGQIPKLTAAERARLPLIYDETNALARMLQNSKAVIDQMVLGEIPARRRIEIQIQRQIDQADREIAAYRTRRIEGKITAAELEAAETQYTASVVSLSAQRKVALREETKAQADAMAAQVVSLLETLGYRRAAAIVEALWETAASIASFAHLDFYGGTMHALAAAQYWAVAAQAGKGATSSAMGGTVSPTLTAGAGGGGPTAAGSPSQLTPGAASPPATTGAERQQTVQIIFQGPVYGGQAGIDQLVRDVSEAVTERDVNLVAYTVVRQPAVRA